MFSWMTIGGPMMWVLAAISIAALSIFIERFLFLHRSQIKTGDFLKGLFNVLGSARAVPPNAVVEAVSICDQTEGPVPRMVRAAVLNWENGPAQVRHAMEVAGIAEIQRLERFLGLLLTLAQSAPIAGLLGTVLGLMNVLRTIMDKAQLLHAGDLAGGLWQSLISTAFGLAIALPVYIGYNFLVTRVDSIVLDMERTCADVECQLRQRPDGILESP